MTAPPRPRAAAVLLLAGVSLCWGLNWPLMKLALETIPILSFRALCLIASGPLMLAIVTARGERLYVPRGERRNLILATLLNVSLWNLLSATGLALLPAGRASIIAYTMPAWATLLGALFLAEPLTRRSLLGLLLGMAGLLVLLVPEWRGLVAAPAGALAMIGAAISWAGGTILMKRYRWSLSVAAITGWQLTLGGVPIVAAALLGGRFPGLGGASPAALAALVYVIFLGMLFGQWAWFAVLSRLPVAIASIGSLAVPAVGVFASALLLGEPLGPTELGALALVVSALALVLRRR